MATKKLGKKSVKKPAKKRKPAWSGGNTPDGKFAKSFKEYLAAWKDLYDPFCALVNAQVRGFDPGLSIVYAEDQRDQIVQVPVSLVKRVLAGVSVYAMWDKSTSSWWLKS